MKFSGYIIGVFVFISDGFEHMTAKLHNCPLGWEQYGPQCHRFVFYPPRSYTEASRSCQEDGAELIGLNNIGENLFLVAWLNKQERNKSTKWWTSGQYKRGEITWLGNGPFITSSPSLWLGDLVPTPDSTWAIVYEFDSLAKTFKWGLEEPTIKLSFICDIPLNEADRIVPQRDFTYGTDIIDPDLIPRGPKFVVQPDSITVVGDPRDVALECDAYSLPAASYKWYRDLGNGRIARIDDTQNRYTVTNGKLVIHKPSEVLDTGSFRCIASNEIGSVFSAPAGLNFGFLMEFSNDGGGDVQVKLYRGAYISCDTPMHKPSVSIQWYKDVDGPMFLRTDLHPYQYISYNGKLYFSEVNKMDAGVYHCVATLAASSGERLSTDQNPSRTSLGIELVIQGESPSDYGPVIHNDFPFVTPSPPLRGNLLVIECFAYGKPPLHYSWTKDGGLLPQKSMLIDHGRKLIIPDGQLDDSGNYTCRVQRRNRAVVTKTLILQLDAAPFFITSMRDKHVDAGNDVIWLCNAHGLPEPTYTWYKNAKPLLSSELDGVLVRKNRLIMQKVNREKHEGMYQCEAKNRYGISMGTVQLRVLAFAPSFAKHPLDKYQVGTLAGSVTILCLPEASPRPSIDWLKDGFELSLAEDTSSRVHELPNGNLLIKDLQISDEGFYECRATNQYGSASSEGHLKLVERTTVFIAPTDDHVIVHGTVFMPCQASYDAKLQDLVYLWDLNGMIIDTEHHGHFSSGFRDGVPGLYIMDAQLNYTGTYTCMATTVYGKTGRSAFLQVKGPPGECSGLVGRVMDRNITLRWVEGEAHGSKVLRFHIQYHTNFNAEWRTILENVPYYDVIEQSDKKRYRANITDLRPGSSYSFRVIAINSFGLGPPSRKSPMYTIPDTPPTVAVLHIMEGSGPVGTLPIVWEKLTKEELTGSGIGYLIFFRKKSTANEQWSEGRVEGHRNYFAAMVGADNYFLEYEVMVCAFNSLGSGPNSTHFVVMSAEDVPLGAPFNVYGDSVNATAILVYWDPIADTRTTARGKILGYQVNYWSQNLDDPEVGSTSIYCNDNCGEGLVVALDTNEDYWITVQVFTGGGMGPLSESGEGSTTIFPPLTYPEFVSVSSHPGNSVSVHWRGVTTGLLEETLIGYKLRWWGASDDILMAHEVLVQEKRTYGVISGLERNVVYALRVNGFSAGGDGKKSPTIFFTMEGGQVIVNLETTAIMNTAHADVGTSFQTLLTTVVVVSLFLRSFH